MNFTKQYIDLCKNPKLQGLRKKLKVGDWFFDLDAEEFEKKINIMTNDIDDINFGDNFIWLPTGDDLEKHILKICRKRQLAYSATYEYYDGNKLYCNVFAPLGSKNDALDITKEDKNPLIAKLKLLLSLLEMEG